MRRAAPPGQARQVEAQDVADAERLTDRQGSVEEVEIGRDELDLDQLAGQVPERDHRLERCDAAARDQHMALTVLPGHLSMVGPTGRGTHPCPHGSPYGKAATRSGRPPMPRGEAEATLRRPCFHAAMRSSGEKARVRCVRVSSCWARPASGWRPGRRGNASPRRASATRSSRRSRPQPLAQRIRGRPTAVVERHGRDRLAIAAVDGLGAVHEIVERLARLLPRRAKP